MPKTRYKGWDAHQENLLAGLAKVHRGARGAPAFDKIAAVWLAAGGPSQRTAGQLRGRFYNVMARPPHDKATERIMKSHRSAGRPEWHGDPPGLGRRTPEFHSASEINRPFRGAADTTAEINRARKAATPTSYLGQDARVKKQGCVTWSAQPTMARPGTAAFRAYSKHSSEAAEMRGFRLKVTAIQRKMAATGWPDDPPPG